MITASPFKTARLSLDPLTAADIPAIFEIARNKQSIEDFRHVAETLDDVRAWLEPDLENESTLSWTIRKDGRIIGFCELCLEAEYSQWTSRVCRIGFFVDHREQNRGYATEAVSGVVAWVFATTDIERIEAGVTLHNVPSYRVLEKVGFVREKVVPRNWKWRDEVFDSAYYCRTRR